VKDWIGKSEHVRLDVRQEVVVPHHAVTHHLYRLLRDSPIEDTVKGRACGENEGFGRIRTLVAKGTKLFETTLLVAVCPSETQWIEVTLTFSG
jgi:hypothetical protein